jgi:hypothetical protein
VLLIRKFREAFKILFSVGAVVSRVFFLEKVETDFSCLYRKKRIKTFFVVNGCVSARDCLLY